MQLFCSSLSLFRCLVPCHLDRALECRPIERTFSIGHAAFVVIYRQSSQGAFPRSRAFAPADGWRVCCRSGISGRSSSKRSPPTGQLPGPHPEARCELAAAAPAAAAPPQAYRHNRRHPSCTCLAGVIPLKPKLGGQTCSPRGPSVLLRAAQAQALKPEAYPRL